MAILRQTLEGNMSGSDDSDTGELVDPGDTPTDPSQLQQSSSSERLKALDALGDFESRLNQLEREKRAEQGDAAEE